MIDLAIVGAGPAGLYAAARCAEEGLEVLVLEEHPVVGAPTHCTGIASLEVTEFAKVEDELILGRPTRACLSSPRGEQCHVRWEAQGNEQILVLDRARFDRSLADRVVSGGGRIAVGVRVDGISVDAQGVDVRAGDRKIRARACVLACGVSYRLQRQLGLGMPSTVVHTAQIEVAAEPADTVELHFGQTAAPGGFLWTVPVVRAGARFVKVGVLARGDAGDCLRRFVARPDFRPRLTAEPGRPIRRLLPLSPIARTYADRLLVVGDAGGFTKPTTGGGIFYSLLTASLAAETLVEAFGAGRLDEASLAVYERCWQERLGQELRVATWLRQLLAKCTDPEIDTFVRALATEDVQEVLRRSVRFNWHRDAILALVRQPGVASLLFRSLFR